MRPLTLKLKAKPPCLIDASPLLPNLLAERSLNDIRGIALQGWNSEIAVGDLFTLRGENRQHIVFEDLDGSLVRIGAELTSGTLEIHGDGGDYVGEAMRGGTITVAGRAGAYLGAGMKRGQIDVKGAVGMFAGAGRAGEMQGMSGGLIVVRGKAGDRLGDRMRRGIILVEDSVGSYCASRMLAGTILALGTVGAHPGYLMRRGTLIFGDRDPPILPTFNDNGVQDLLAIRLLLRSLAQHGQAFSAFADRVSRLRRWLGDLGADGKGEILVA